MDSFDSLLERQLQAKAAAAQGPHPTHVQARYHQAYIKGRARVPLLAKLAALASAKVALGWTLGILAVSAAGMAGEAAITGSTDPTNWGQQVVQQVQKCKAALAPGSHGIGQCVSAFASQHGQGRASEARTNEPSPSPDKTKPGKSKDKGKGQGNGNGNGNSQGQGNGNGGNGNSQGQGKGHGGNGNSQGDSGGSGSGGSGGSGSGGSGGGGNGH